MVPRPIWIADHLSVGATIVTEVTFTSANDAPDRDPVAFERYGSKASIGGPYTLIARELATTAESVSPVVPVFLAGATFFLRRAMLASHRFDVSAADGPARPAAAASENHLAKGADSAINE